MALYSYAAGKGLRREERGKQEKINKVE